jgi:hypothetical protein
MEAYLTYANFTLNPRKDGDNRERLNLKTLYNTLKIGQMTREKHTVVKQMRIERVEVCSSSKGCAPKTKKSKMLTNGLNKTTNYLTAMKTQNQNIKTKRADNEMNYVLLNIYGICTVGNTEENFMARVPQTAVIGLKVGLSKQNLIEVRNPQADQMIDTLLKEMQFFIWNFVKINQSPRYGKLSSLSIQGFNLNDPSGGSKPEFRIKNFIRVMTMIDDKIKSHELHYIERETRLLPKVYFRPSEGYTGPTIGITKWLTVDFTGVLSIAQVRDISIVLYQAYRQIKQNVQWNTNYVGNIPKSRRQNKNKKETKKQTPQINIPSWNQTLQKYKYKGKNFNCESISKPELQEIAKKMDISPKGFKKDLCNKIQSALKGKNAVVVVPNDSIMWNKNKKKYMMSGRVFNCEVLKKEELVRIAQKLDINDSGTKKDLCNKIHATIKKD